jgi:hypothetical protein
MDALQAIHGRRSIRAYERRPVPRAILEQALWAAVQAPIPPVSDESPWVIVVVEGVDTLYGYGEQAKRHAFEHQPPDRVWEWTTRPGFKVF